MKGGADSEHWVRNRLKKVGEKMRPKSHIYESKQDWKNSDGEEWKTVAVKTSLERNYKKNLKKILKTTSYS